jgi:iron(III) transport system ATP-binding protein
VADPAAIDAVKITKRFGGVAAVDDASVVVPRGHIVALLGPSGAGKTSLLRTIAGFEDPDEGTVMIGGRVVVAPDTWVEPDQRRVGMVFQDGALFPHLTVEANVGFSRPRGGRVTECLELVGLAHRRGAYPHELSGGERQRVALARALAADPEVVLMDEPFASLDTALRASLRHEVMQILRETGASALLVTHDQHEALSVADTIVLMRDGRVEQTGGPEQIYAAPRTRWAAEFLGAVDVLPGRASDGIVTCQLGTFPSDGVGDGDVDVLVRPEAVAIGPADAVGHDGSPAAPATVIGRSFFGADQLVHVRLSDGTPITSRRPGYVHWYPGDVVAVWVEGPVTALAAQHR